MVASETLLWDGHDHYQIKNVETNSQVASFQTAIPFFQGLNEKSIEWLELKKNDVNASPKPGMMAAQVYSTNKQTMEKINAVLTKAYSDIYKIRSDDKEPHDEVCCMHLQVFNLVQNNL